jgi:hypothetical protein
LLLEHAVESNVKSDEDNPQDDAHDCKIYGTISKGEKNLGEDKNVFQKSEHNKPICNQNVAGFHNNADSRDSQRDDCCDYEWEVQLFNIHFGHVEAFVSQEVAHVTFRA